MTSQLRRVFVRTKTVEESMFGPSKKSQQEIEKQLVPGDQIILTTNGQWTDWAAPTGREGLMQTHVVTLQGVLVYASDTKLTVTLGMKFVLGERLFARPRADLEAVMRENGHTVVLRERATGADVGEATFGAARKRAAAEYLQAVNA